MFPSVDVVIQSSRQLLRWNLQQRKGTSLVYLTKFALHPLTENSSLKGAAAEELTADPFSRSVVRFKQRHVASLLFQLNGGAVPMLHMRNHRISASNDIVIPLADPYFQLQSSCEYDANGRVTRWSLDGKVWRDSMTSVDAWRPVDKLDGPRAPNEVVSPSAVIVDPVHIIGLRNFLESSLVSTFGFDEIAAPD